MGLGFAPDPILLIATVSDQVTNVAMGSKGQYRNSHQMNWCLILKSRNVVALIVPRRTMRKLTPDELVRDSQVKKRSDFDAVIKERYGDSFTLPTKHG